MSEPILEKLDKALKNSSNSSLINNSLTNNINERPIKNKKYRQNSINFRNSGQTLEEQTKTDNVNFLENKCHYNCQNIPYLRNCEDKIKDFLNEVNRVNNINSSLMLRIKNTEEMFSELLKEKNYILSQFRTLLTKTKKQDRVNELEKFNGVNFNCRFLCPNSNEFDAKSC